MTVSAKHSVALALESSDLLRVTIILFSLYCLTDWFNKLYLLRGWVRFWYTERVKMKTLRCVVFNNWNKTTFQNQKITTNWYKRKQSSFCYKMFMLSFTLCECGLVGSIIFGKYLAFWWIESQLQTRTSDSVQSCTNAASGGVLHSMMTRLKLVPHTGADVLFRKE